MSDLLLHLAGQTWSVSESLSYSAQRSVIVIQYISDVVYLYWSVRTLRMIAVIDCVSPVLSGVMKVRESSELSHAWCKSFFCRVCGLGYMALVYFWQIRLAAYAIQCIYRRAFR